MSFPVYCDKCGSQMGTTNSLNGKTSRCGKCSN